MIVAVVVIVTEVVVTGNVADEEPAGTSTVAGTAALPLLLPRETTAPAAGAGPVRVTVPVDDDPPVTCAGFSVTDVSEAATGAAGSTRNNTPSPNAPPTTVEPYRPPSVPWTRAAHGS